MKKILMIVCCILMGLQLNAQNSRIKGGSARPAPGNAAAAQFCCISCDYCSPNAGSCPTHKKTLVKEGMYYCENMDSPVSAKPGFCSKDNLTLKQMPKKAKAGSASAASASPKASMPQYCCISCEYCSPSPGNCPTHKKTLVKEGMYYCENMDSPVSANPGFCSKDNLTLKKMERRSK
jgi:hypothetical protein